MLIIAACVMMLVKGFVEVSPPVKDEDTLQLLQ